MPTDTTRAGDIVAKRNISFFWMKDNFFPELEKVYKAYCNERDPELDEKGKADPTQTSIAMPDTWSHVRRSVARATAQIPNLAFRSKDQSSGELIGHTLMYNWDRGGVQRLQKRHVLQAMLFGISVRPWYWAKEEYERHRRIDPLDPNLDPQALQLISGTYKVPMRFLQDPEIGVKVKAKLLGKYGKGGLIPVEYTYKAYEGPKCDFLFLGDCYFQPQFQSLQSSEWFITQRRRDLNWIKRVVQTYPEFREGFEALLTLHPRGTPQPIIQRDTENLRRMLWYATGRNDADTQLDSSTKMWTITEMHCPGRRPKLSYVGEEAIWIGEIDYPYDLDGKIAFTDLIFIDNLLSGFGDSTGRMMRGIQALHDRQACRRMDIVDTIQRPLIGTTNRELYENPELLKRHAGFRLVHMRGPGDMWQQGEQAALAAVATSLQDESAIYRLIQMATGESNMSMSAGVDPQQGRTATGARLMAYNQDVLTKDMNDMLNVTGIQPDAEMMFLLNRSELSEPVKFDRSAYNRDFSIESDQTKQQWVAAEPADFQVDGEIMAEVGSTLADDDDAKMTKAQNVLQVAMTSGGQLNVRQALTDYLIAQGKGRQISLYIMPPPPPPPKEIKASLSVAAKLELLPPQVQNQVMQDAGFDLAPPQPPPSPGGPGPGGPPPPPPGPGGPMPPPPPEQDPLLAASSLAAASGHSPLRKEGMPA